MIYVFNLLVFGVLIGVLREVYGEYRARRLRSPVGIPFEDLATEQIGSWSPRRYAPPRMVPDGRRELAIANVHPSFAPISERGSV